MAGHTTALAAHVTACAATGPANDSEILAPARPTSSPRHGALAEQLMPLLDLRALEAAAEPVTSTWLDHDNDNEAPARDADCLHEIRPTVNEIMRAYEQHGTDGFCFTEGGALARWRNGDAWQKPREQYRSPKGEPLPVRSLHHLRRVLSGTGEPGAALPTWGNPADSFLGGMIHANPRAAAAQAIDRRQEKDVDRMYAAIRFATVRNRLPEKHKKTVEAFNDNAQSFADIGRAHGYSGKTAERQGKRLSLEAAEELRRLLDDSDYTE